MPHAFPLSYTEPFWLCWADSVEEACDRRDGWWGDLKLRLMLIEARLCGGPEPMSLEDPGYHAWKEARSRREREGLRLIERMEPDACLGESGPL